MAENPMKRTAYAQQGLDFATLFAAKFGSVDISAYHPALREPHGESTGGGAQALQHLMLVSRTPEAPVITIGSVNVATKTAKLRTYGCLQLMHERRYKGGAFSIDHGRYQEFFDSLLSFMKYQQMQVQIESQPPTDPISLRPAGRMIPEGARAWVFLIVLVILMLLLGYMLGSGGGL